MAKHYPKGVCLYMCPSREISEREKAGLVHKFEAAPSTNVYEVPLDKKERRGHGRRDLPKADKDGMVKCYSRSAAGMDKTNPNDLRPPKVLYKTLVYLCNEILPRNDPFNVIYDFVFDRMRAIRQDLVIQRINDIHAILILETIVRFHVYSGYRLRNEPMSIFDPFINTKHLNDCLETLITLYEANDYFDGSRFEFEGLYLLTSPNSYKNLSRAFSIRNLICQSIQAKPVLPSMTLPLEKWALKGFLDIQRVDSEPQEKPINYKTFSELPGGTRKYNPLFNTVIDLVLVYQARNYVRFFRMMNQLPEMLGAYLVNQIRYMRSSAFKIISAAYGVKSCAFPISKLEQLLCYPTQEPDLLKSDLKSVSAILVEQTHSVQFFKEFKTIDEKVLSDKIQITDKLNWDLMEKDCTPIVQNYMLHKDL